MVFVGHGCIKRVGLKRRENAVRKQSMRTLVVCLVAGFGAHVGLGQDCFKIDNYGASVWGIAAGSPCWIECQFDVTKCASGTVYTVCDDVSQQNACSRGTTVILSGGMTDCVAPFTPETINTNFATFDGECKGGGGES